MSKDSNLRLIIMPNITKFGTLVDEKLKLIISKFLKTNIDCLNIEDLSQKYGE